MAHLPRCRTGDFSTRPARYAHGVDGRRQRRALTAAEGALRSLDEADPTRARTEAAKAAELDGIGVFERLVPAIEDVADQMERGEPVGPERWSRLVDAVPEGPLRAVAESLGR